MQVFLILSCAFAAVVAQNAGTQNVETPLNMNIQVCTGPGNCQTEADGVVLDSNWRWTHKVNDYVNCYTGNVWDSSLCSSPDACTTNCAVEGITQSEWGGTYGMASTGSELSLRLVTQGQYSKNIGGRTYLLDSSKQKYRMFNLMNREFTLDVDVSTLACGLNGALYFVEMDADGGLSKYPTNQAGAKYGTGYCDAQCPHDVKWINGKANSGDWQPSSTDPNSGKGRFGTCCAEMDIWEANRESQAFTTHPCSIVSQVQCEGTQCGDNDSGDRYNGVCDKDGCDFASYRLGDRSFYGAGSGFAVDTSRKFTIVTQFLTTDGTDNGDLKEIRRFYVQDGRRIENSQSNLPGFGTYDSITEDFCVQSKTLFGDIDDHTRNGGLKAMGDALRRGMVLVLSLWDDHDANMLWLDSNFPTTEDPNKPGVARGPCPTSSGVPSDVEQQNGDATVKFSNIKFGPIGSTTF